MTPTEIMLEARGIATDNLSGEHDEGLERRVTRLVERAVSNAKAEEFARCHSEIANKLAAKERALGESRDMFRQLWMLAIGLEAAIKRWQEQGDDQAKAGTELARNAMARFIRSLVGSGKLENF